MFKLLSSTRTDRHTQVFCDTDHHIEIVYPLHEHSGEGPGLDLIECDCPKPDPAPLPPKPPTTP